MANGMERGRIDNSGSAFAMGLFTGAVLGAGLGLLLAPRAGSELREQITDSVTGLGDSVSKTYRRASEQVSQAVDDVSTRGRRMYHVAKVVSDATAEVGRAASDGAKRVGRSLASVR